MPQLAAAQGSVFAAKPQQLLHIRKNLLLISRAARLRERIVRITNPSAGKIAPVVRVAASGHPDLIAVINLRNASQRERESKRESQLCGRATFGARKTRYIVIRKKWDEQFRMHIQGIVPQHVRDASRGSIPQQYVAEREKHRKVEDRGESAIDAVVAPYPTYKKRSHARIAMKHFANRGQIRIEPP